MFKITVVRTGKRNVAFDVKKGGLLTVGPSFDSDIVLGASKPNGQLDGSQKLYFSLHSSAEKLLLKHLSVPLTINGNELLPGATRALVGDEKIDIGELSLMVVCLDKEAGAEVDGYFPRVESLKRWWDKNVNTDFRLSKLLPKSASTTSYLAVFTLPVLVFGFVAMIMAAANNATGSGKGTGSAFEVASGDIAEYLSDERYMGVTARLNDPEIEIKGWVDSNKDYADLHSFVLSTEYSATENILVAANYEAAVEDYLRLNEVMASVTISNAGDISLAVEDSNNQSLATIESLVKNEFQLLNIIDIESLKSNVGKPASPGKDNSFMNDSFITMVVTSTPVHIATVNGDMYYVGSTLPSGHQITGIEPGSIYLVINGTQTIVKY